MTWYVSKIFWRILLNYNLPFFLWLGSALFPILGIVIFEKCLIANIFGHCFGCGLTHDLVAIMSLEQTKNPLAFIVLVGFLVNLLYSLKIAYSKVPRGA